MQNEGREKIRGLIFYLLSKADRRSALLGPWPFVYFFSAPLTQKVKLCYIYRVIYYIGKDGKYDENKQ